MVSSSNLKARAIASLVVSSVVLSGCQTLGGMFGRDRESSSPPPVQTASSAALESEQAVAEDLTAPETATETSSAPASTGAGTSILRADAPKSYVVKRGDNLWDLPSMFLK